MDHLGLMENDFELGNESWKIYEPIQSIVLYGGESMVADKLLTYGNGSCR